VPESEIDSSSRNSPVSEISEQLPFLILDEASKSFRKFNATGRSLLITFRPPTEDVEPTLCLKECITALTIYLTICVIEIWWVSEFATPRMSRISLWVLVSDTVTG